MESRLDSSPPLFFVSKIGIVRLNATHNVELSILHRTGVLFCFGGRDGQVADYYTELFTREIGAAPDRGLDTLECGGCRLDFPGESPVFRQQVGI